MDQRIKADLNQGRLHQLTSTSERVFSQFTWSWRPWRRNDNWVKSINNWESEI